MKIAGTNTLALTQEEAYRRMQDPEVLAACMPGCEGLEKIGEDEYKMKMKLALALLPAVRWKESRFVLETCPVGPSGPISGVVGMFTVKTGTGLLTPVLSVTE